MRQIKPKNVLSVILAVKLVNLKNLHSSNLNYLTLKEE